MEEKEHPIEQIMETTLDNLKQMMDINTIVGDSVVMANGTVILPISKVKLGFVAGGGEYGEAKKASDEHQPFAGGAGAGVSVRPMAFLVAAQGQPVQLLPVEGVSTYDRLAELLPRVLMEVKDMFQRNKSESE